MAEALGTGPQGMVMPADLDDAIVDEAAALGNGEDVPEGAPQGAGDEEGRDWSEIDRHSDRVIRILGGLLWKSGDKAQAGVGQLLRSSEEKAAAHFRDLKIHVTGTMGLAGRAEVAAAWRGPAEALRLLGGALAGLSGRAGEEAVGAGELATLLPVLRTAEELLRRAAQHEEGAAAVIDEMLGGTATLETRIAAVAESVGEAAALAERMARGADEGPGRRALAVRLAGCVVDLGGVFGAEGEGSEFVRRVERLRRERAGPVEAAESIEARAFRADFGREVKRLRKAMRWRERGMWVAGAGFCLLLGWAVGIS